MKNRWLYKFLFIIVSIGIVITLQLLSRYLVENYSLKIDLTENSLYEFSDTTKEIIESLETPVNIIIFSSKEDYVIMLREVFNKYDNLSDNIVLTYADPLENPVLVDKYLKKGIHINDNDIVIEGGKDFQVFSIEDMYLFNNSKTKITGLNAEQKITSAILTVNSHKVYSAGFIDGHNERPTESLINLFQQNSFLITRGSIKTILSHTPDLIIIASPDRDFRSEEIDLLDSFMEAGGSLMIFLEPSKNKLENLDSLIAQWGIIPGDSLVFEKEAYTGNNPLNIVPMYEPHEINRYFMDTRVFVTMPSSRNLNIRPDIGSAYDVSPVLVSTKDSFGKTGTLVTQKTREKQDVSGPFYLAISSEKELFVNNSRVKSRLFVAGSRNIYADDLLSFSSYGNSDFLIQVIDWLTDRDDFLNISPKNIQAPPLNIKRNQSIILGSLVSIFIPLIIITTGVVLVLRRKKLK